MKYIPLVGIVIASALAMPVPALARLATASSNTLTAQGGAVIMVKGGHGHMGHGGHGHRYGWGRGHHYGWRHHRDY
jgi:hypothetical protein